MAFFAKRSSTRYDLVILGGDAAAIAAAEEARRRGARTALVWPEEPPVSAPPVADWAQAITEKRRRMGWDLPAVSTAPEGLHLVRGTAMLVGPRRLRVGQQMLTFRRLLLATGTERQAFLFPGIGEAGCLYGEQLAVQPRPPQRVAVIGSGAEACIWAQMLRRAGSNVFLFSPAEQFLPEADPAVGTFFENRLRQQRVRLYGSAEILIMEKMVGLRAVIVRRPEGKEKILVEEILLCPPRRPRLPQRADHVAAAACTEFGVLVGERLQTTVRRIYAAGAVCGGRFAAPAAAVGSARRAVHNALSWSPRRVRHLALPYGAATEPPWIQLGLTRREIHVRGWETESRRLDLCVPQGQTPDAAGGFLEIHLRKGAGQIVGVTAVAEAADELLSPLQLCLLRGWPLTTAAELIPLSSPRLEALIALCRGAKAAAV